MNYPDQLLYHSDHLWVRDSGDSTVRVGITDYAQEQLGKVVYVDLPEEGDEVTAGEEMGAVESAKSVSDLVAPVSGEVVEFNVELLEDPSPINEDPYGDGWLAVIKLSDETELNDLLPADDYRAATEE